MGQIKTIIFLYLSKKISLKINELPFERDFLLYGVFEVSRAECKSHRSLAIVSFSVWRISYKCSCNGNLFIFDCRSLRLRVPLLNQALSRDQEAICFVVDLESGPTF